MVGWLEGSGSPAAIKSAEVASRKRRLSPFRVPRWINIANLLANLPGERIGFLIFVNLFIFVLAFFLDFFEIAFIVIPLLTPAAEKLGRVDFTNLWAGQAVRMGREMPAAELTRALAGSALARLQALGH